MQTLIVERNGRLFLTGEAHLVRSPEDVSEETAQAANWEIEKSNPFVKWITGNFVEGDNPNGNRQYWTKDDLALGEHSIKYAPLNMLHKQRVPIGFYLATKSVDLTPEQAALDDFTEEEILEAKQTDWGQTPNGANAPYKIQQRGEKWVVVNNTGEVKASFGSRPQALQYQRALYANVPGAGKRADKVPFTGKAKNRIDKSDGTGTMRIEALSGMWAHLFPFESALVDQADEAGNLFYSMECRGTHLHCAGEQGCGNLFEYMQPETHCPHLQERSSIRHIVNPTFRGGALIIPPVQPGWKEAHASVYEDAVRDEARAYAELTESAYRQLQDGGADISPASWERLMASVLSLA